jgi:hypothetical protein
MPGVHGRRDPDHIPRANFLDRASPALDQAAARELVAELLALPQKAATRTKHFVDGIFIGPHLYSAE